MCVQHYGNHIYLTYNYMHKNMNIQPFRDTLVRALNLIMSNMSSTHLFVQTDGRCFSTNVGFWFPLNLSLKFPLILHQNY